MIVKSVPQNHLVVHHNRIDETESMNGGFDIRANSAKREFGSMNPDNHEAAGSIFTIHFLQKRKRPDAIHTGVFPKVDQNDFPLKVFPGERRGIDPGRSSFQRRDRFRLDVGDSKEEKGNKKRQNALCPLRFFRIRTDIGFPSRQHSVVGTFEGDSFMISAHDNRRKLFSRTGEGRKDEDTGPGFTLRDRSHTPPESVYRPLSDTSGP